MPRSRRGAPKTPKNRRCRDCGHVVKRTLSTKCPSCGGFLRVHR